MLAPERQGIVMNHIPESAIIIESVPNFSEGRRPAVIQAILDAIQAPEVLLLNYSSDWDHNRSVVTIAGPPAAILEGLFRATQVAANIIDLTTHQGVHPRMGATDVIPLVPLQNSTVAECVLLAHALGERIGRELALPVYLYEAAAKHDERRLLADVRRGGYELLAQEIALPHRLPDFGPPQVGSAGAVIVGARTFLIAYNIYLQSSDLQIARRIARAIRERDGGLPAVRAIGVLVNGEAQVSMNLVDFRQTPLHVLFAEVARLADEQGTAIDRSELIGLMPQEAMAAVAANALKLTDFSADALLENALARASSQRIDKSR